jgi:hypothetical protein
MILFLDQNISAIAPDTAGSGAQQPVVRIEYRQGDGQIEITLEAKAIAAINEAYVKAEGMIP